jgi:hypothetical protein
MGSSNRPFSAACGRCIRGRVELLRTFFSCRLVKHELSPLSLKNTITMHRSNQHKPFSTSANSKLLIQQQINSA